MKLAKTIILGLFIAAFTAAIIPAILVLIPIILTIFWCAVCIGAAWLILEFMKSDDDEE